ncbi:MAG: hypothetical protein QOE44_1231 [Solirubrobacteraceae bacterium]|nr:hypothetical protein [Solirubrobacteraceae bacterium]
MGVLLYTLASAASARTAGSPMSVGSMVAIIFATLIAVCLVIAGIWYVTAKLGSRQPPVDPKPPPSTQ